ncbi:hypothetical protein KGP36_04070 [Patescibacteria group bacterium]|nr:hypothetical protein [Patescibacteria group bacterium]
MAASKAVVVDANKRADALVIGTLSLGAGAGTAVTATAAELNVLHSVVAGTVAVSSALVVDANKRLDTLVLGTLNLGAAGGTAVTATAPEINVLHGVTAGTTLASGAVVVDANKRTDALVLGTLSLGAGAGTAVTATAPEINVLHGVTAGTAAASSATVLDASKQLDVRDTKTAFKLNAVDVFGVLGAGKSDRVPKIAKLTANGGTDTGGGITSWVNPEAGAIMIMRCWLDVTTVATGVCTVSVGTTAVSGTTLANNLLNGQDTHSATGVFNYNPPAVIRLAAGAWVTASTATGASGGQVANLYIEYINI